MARDSDLANGPLPNSSAASLDGYSSLAITAHSMGGLVAQRALIDDTQLANRTAYLTMFCTPSAGLRKAGWLKLLNTQARDMDDDGRFVTDLG